MKVNGKMLEKGKHKINDRIKEYRHWEKILLLLSTEEIPFFWGGGMNGKVGVMLNTLLTVYSSLLYPFQRSLFPS
jgi:hypothetical protein